MENGLKPVRFFRKETDGMMKKAAVIVAAGKGRRMGTEMPKQYLPLLGMPVLAYSIRAFQEYGVDKLIVVCAAGEEEYIRTEIAENYQLGAFILVPGGKERSDSVYQGLLAAEGTDLVFIHDAARPLIDRDTIFRTEEAAVQYGAAVAAVPVKDTIKEADQDGFVERTPDRNRLWAVQTPQTFLYDEIRRAHELAIASGDHAITDDAGVVERYLKKPVRLVMGDYRNQKLTTPDDLKMLEGFLQ